MFWLIFALLSVYVPAVVGFASAYEHRIRAAVVAFVLTTLWLWGLLALAT